MYRSQILLVQDQMGDMDLQDLDEIFYQHVDMHPDMVLKSDLDSAMGRKAPLHDVLDLQPGDHSLAGDSGQLDLELTDKPPIDVGIRAEVSVNTFGKEGQGLFSVLFSLHSQYQQSISKLSSLSELKLLAPQSTPPSIVTTTAPPEQCETLVTEAQAEYTMSKTQDQLTLEEGKFWAQIIQSPTLLEDAETMEPIVNSLEQKSSVLSESYNRRTNPPTSVTYDESKEILSAMGVPCIETQGAFEAEALASSLVINGFADYVASEDTVRCQASELERCID